MIRPYFLLTLSLIILSGQLYAQESVHYDDPYAIRNCNLFILPGYMDAYQSNLTGGAGLRLETQFGRFGIWSEFRHAYWDGNQKKKSMEMERITRSILPDGGLKAAQWFELAIGYALIDKATYKARWVPSVKEKDEDKDMQKYTRIATKRRYQLFAKTGFYHNRTSLLLESGGDELVIFEPLSGISLTGNPQEVYTNQRSAIFSLGLNYRVLSDFRTKTAYDDTRIDLFFDLLLSGSQRYDEVIRTKDDFIWEPQVQVQGRALTKTGFRLGFNFLRSNRMGFTYRVETGIRPGYTNQRTTLATRSNFFIFGTMGMNVPFRVK